MNLFQNLIWTSFRARSGICPDPESSSGWRQ